VQELEEWLDAIAPLREGGWDSAKHPRGGFRENPGWFSPTGGSGSSAKPSGAAGPLRSWPEERSRGPENSDPKSHAGSSQTDANGGAEHGTLVAQLPPRPAIQPAAAPQAPQFVFGRPFGDFPKQKDLVFAPGATAGVQFGTGASVQRLADATEAHVKQQVPQEIRDALAAGGVKTLYTDSLNRHKDILAGTPTNPGKVAGALYSPTAGTIFVPEVMSNGKPNTFVENNARHEMGHGVDDMTNGSLAHDFLEQYRADVSAIKLGRRLSHGPIKDFVPETYQRPPYNLPPAEAEHWAAREAYAQAFADVTAARDAPEHATVDGMPEARDFRKDFPSTRRYMRDIVLPGFKNRPRQPQQPGQPRP
jgi:hypothetical protein